MRNKVGLDYFKAEYEGVLQEKEDTKLVINDQKKKLVYDKEDIAILRLQN